MAATSRSLFGEGIPSYMNDGGMDLAPQVQATTPTLTGVVAYSTTHGSEVVQFHRLQLHRGRHGSFQDGSAFRKGEYASVNLLVTPAKNIMMGGELLWGKRTNNDGRSDDAVMRFRYGQVQLQPRALTARGFPFKETNMNFIDSGYKASRAFAAGAILALAMAVPAYAGQAPATAGLSPQAIQAALDSAYNQFKGLKEGANADYIPALAKVDPNIFGIALVTTDGRVYTKGDISSEVSIQSISKVFTMAKVIDERGSDAISTGVGVDATGQVFNSIVAVEQYRGAEMNAMVNPGAIATTSMVSGKTRAEVWARSSPSTATLQVGR